MFQTHETDKSPKRNPKSVHYQEGKSKHTQGKGKAREGGARQDTAEQGRREGGKRGEGQGMRAGTGKEGQGRAGYRGIQTKNKNSVKNSKSVCQTESREKTVKHKNKIKAE